MLVPEEEAPQEDDVNGSTMAEDDEGSRSDVGVSSTVVLSKPILILAPVRASVYNQQAVEGRGTKDHPYKLDFASTMCGGHGVPLETHQE